MTVVVAAKGYEGLVIGADSTTSLFMPFGPAGAQVYAQTYDNVNKIVNLHKGLPIGLATWGLGSIGVVSISTLAKDLRRRLMDGGSGTTKLNRSSYSIEQIAKTAKKFFFDEKFSAAYPDPKQAPQGATGFFIFGMSANADHAEAWQFQIINGQCADAHCLIAKDDNGIWAFGQPEAAFRLMLGFDEGRLSDFLTNFKKMAAADVRQWIAELRQHMSWPMLHSAMPIQDVIDITRSMVQITIDCSHFKLEPQTVGGLIDIATVTKHEGFKWIQRKYYFDGRLNPEE